MKIDRVPEQPMDETERRDVLADKGSRERPAPDKAEQRWEDEGGSSR